MAKIWIEPAKIRAALGQQEALAKALTSLYQDAGNIRSSLRYKISGREAISARLQEAAGQISREAESTRALRAALEQAVGLYEKTEKANVDRVKAERTSIQQGGTAWTKVPVTPDSILPGINPIWNKILETAGPCVTPVQQRNPVEDFFDWLGSGVEQVISVGAEWGDLFFGVLEDLGHGVSNAVSSGVTWGLSFLSNLFENAEEFGSNAWNTVQFWGETIVESALDIGTGILATIGSTIALGTSAPATAVAIVAIGTTFVVNLGLDGFTSLVTGGEQTSWTEAVSDFVCDSTEKIVKNVGPVVTKAVDAAADTGKKLLDAGADLISEVFSGVKWGALFA